jgi:hypothetical protein
MTPPRLNELRCPGCEHISWAIDSDYFGMDGVMRPYPDLWTAHDGPAVVATKVVAATTDTSIVRPSVNGAA